MGDVALYIAIIMDLTVHNVQKIEVDIPQKSSMTGNYYRTLKIIQKSGEELEISLFSDEWNKLLIKKEE